MLTFGLPSLVSILVTFAVLRWLARRLLQGPLKTGVDGKPLSQTGKLTIFGIGFLRLHSRGDTARMAQVLADEICGKTSMTVPDIASSAARSQQEVRKYYEARGLPIAPEASDVISPTQNVASILASLQDDIHSTFANRQHGIGGLPQSRVGEASSNAACRAD